MFNNKNFMFLVILIMQQLHTVPFLSYRGVLYLLVLSRKDLFFAILSTESYVTKIIWYVYFHDSNSHIIIIIIIIIIISFMHAIYSYIPETNYVPTEYSVAAILFLLFIVFYR